MKLFFTLFLLLPCLLLAQTPTYIGSAQCAGCHSGAYGSQYPQWQTSLHSKIHQVPSSTNITGDFVTNTSISMGSSYGNAIVTVRTSGGKYYSTVGGTEYEIAYTYGGGWKQRYLVKIDSSYYILPFQWNSKGYLNNSSGVWASYTPATWFNSDGSPKPINNNSFRSKSWDKNCMGCHVSGYKVDMSIAGVDTFWVGTWGASKTAADINVGCESCHGPASLHPANAFSSDKKIVNPSKLTNKDRELEVCGQCHNRASSWRGAGLVGTHEYGKDEINNLYYVPGDTLSKYMRFDGTPNISGGPGVWPDLETPRQHHQQYQDFLKTKHYSTVYEKINCATCHTSHAASTNPHQIRKTLTVSSTTFNIKDEDNTLCLACHATYAPFSAIPKTWVSDPITYKDSIGDIVNQHTMHGKYDPENIDNTGGIGRCSSCHLTKTAVTANSYDINGHLFNVVSPKKTLDYKNVSSPTLGMINTCSNCHTSTNPNASVMTNVPKFGITDTTYTNWKQVSDIALAETLWNYWQSWGFTGVKEVPSTTPIAYNLSQNYPNPFNPSTKIIVDVAQRNIVKLSIYNIVGQQVATLMDKEMQPGKYEVTWSSRNDYGEPVASGVYLYCLEVGSMKLTKKMLLVR